MFTGIIEAVGRVHSFDRAGTGARLTVEAPFAQELRLGESVAVNGCCLTALDITEAGFTADLSAETLQRTALSSLPPGAEVNLERALRPSDRLGGHIVQGHVDGVGRVVRLKSSPDGEVDLRIRLPQELRRYVAMKGSIAIQGISLTIAGIAQLDLSFAIIPHTLEATALRTLSEGDPVNVEVDLLARYLESLALAGEA